MRSSRRSECHHWAAGRRRHSAEYQSSGPGSAGGTMRWRVSAAGSAARRRRGGSASRGGDGGGACSSGSAGCGGPGRGCPGRLQRVPCCRWTAGCALTRGFPEHETENRTEVTWNPGIVAWSRQRRSPCGGPDVPGDVVRIDCRYGEGCIREEQTRQIRPRLCSSAAPQPAAWHTRP